MHLKNTLIAVGLALLMIIAALGWSRKTGAPALRPVSSRPSSSSTNPVSSAYDQYGEPLNRPGTANAGEQAAEPAIDQGDPNAYVDRYVRSIPQPVVVRPADYANADQGGYREADPPERRDTRSFHHRRSARKSLAIVAGSAAGGAAIGALAGGGKGAGIGALAGGATGLIYDRLTHNH